MLKMIKEYITRFLLLNNINLPINLITHQDKIKFREPNYNEVISYGQDGHDIIKKLMDGNLPMMVSRLGAVELSCLSFYAENRLEKKEDIPSQLNT